MKHKNKFLRILLLVALILSTLATSTINTEVYAAKKVYGDKLKLNNNIKLNKTSKITKTGYYQEDTFFPKKAKTKIKYTIKCSRKSSGKNYVVTYKVTYKYLSDPKISTNKLESESDDWIYGMTTPNAMFTVFDYSTGLSLDGENDCGVTVKSLSDWKNTYYPKQYYKYKYDDDYSENNWLRNYKTTSKSFSVTYPKKYKNVVVGIGFVNKTPDIESDDNPNTLFWKQTAPYGKTDFYKKGKNTMSYMRLNK